MRYQTALRPDLNAIIAKIYHALWPSASQDKAPFLEATFVGFCLEIDCETKSSILDKFIMKISSLIKVTLLSLAMFATVVLADKVEPAKDAVPFNGNHYKAFLDTNSTWWEAKFACDDIGGELVVISSDKENEFVRKLAKENIIWLGGTDEFEEGTWTWDNGEDFKFINWDDNQPSGSSGHNFLTLNGKNGKWADTTDFSGKVKGYVCEWKGTAPKAGKSKDSK